MFKYGDRVVHTSGRTGTVLGVADRPGERFPAASNPSPGYVRVAFDDNEIGTLGDPDVLETELTLIERS